MTDRQAEILADAITEHADAIKRIGDVFDELLRCMCTTSAHGKTACHPTIIIEVEKED